MPVRNAEKYLREALDSVLAQTWEPSEVICIDNGSTDHSRSQLEEAQQRDGRVHIIDCPKVGIVNALNAGLDQVSAEFVARMDADDVALPERFERQVKYLKQRDDVVAVGCRCLVVDEDDDPLEIRGVMVEHTDIEKGLLGGIVSVLCHSSMMFRSCALRAIGRYRADIGVSEDLDLYLRLAEIGRLANIPELSMKIRRWPDSTTGRQTSDEFAWSREKIINEALRRRGLSGQYIDRRRWVFGDKAEAELYRAATALTHGFGKTARKYAWRVVRRTPGKLVAWKVLGRAVFGIPAR
jgi:glycosyltransferase involved in cell wall biosynthesis